MEYRKMVDLRPGDQVYHQQIWWSVIEKAVGTKRIAVALDHPGRDRVVVEREDVDSELLALPGQFLPVQDSPRVGEHGRNCDCDECVSGHA